MLGIWPLICVGFFAVWPAQRALLASVVGGFLLLPSATSFQLQGLPDLDKSSMIAIGTGLGTLLFSRRRHRAGGAWLFYGVGTVFVFSPFATAYLNQDPLAGKMLYFPGLSWYDGLSMAGANLLALVPYWAARRILTDEQGSREILRTVAVAMLVYSLPVLFEIRLSPQLHQWVYGFFPHSFAQQMRAGGFRAVVFLSHGLVVALFLSLALVAVLSFARDKQRLLGFSARLWAGYLLVVLLLEKTLGAFVLGVVFGLVTLFMRRRTQLTLAAAIGIVVCVYPLVRGSQLVPFTTIESLANMVSSDRASSLATRLDNEERLLVRAAERPLFGWGLWGRNRIYDMDSGADLTISDGEWIIQVGVFGWVGYLGLFGLLAVPVVRLWRLSRRYGEVPASQITVALLLVMGLIDLIPNSSQSPVTWLMAGSLLVPRPRRRSAAEDEPEAEVASGEGAVSGVAGT